ncbi:MAG TPA: DNA polymerase/3'-5' exonuclease PolX [Gammaproteobacteria bacterium]|nr:DNA polymerase/3'-5' exonuclease PolX [Gammaproteobacteria bacterium]
MSSIRPGAGGDSVHNAEIAVLLNRLADLLEIEDANPFRVRAYRNAAHVVDSLPREAAEMLAAGEDLSELPGIGKDLAGKIADVAENGRLPLLEEVEQRTPASLAALLQITGLGPKRVHTLYQQLGIRTIEDLRHALDSGQLEGLPGFGELTEAHIRQGLAQLAPGPARVLLAQAEPIARDLLAYLQQTPGLTRLAAAGSFRRRKETVGDLDLLATCRKNAPVMERFTAYGGVAEVLSQGSTRSTVRLRSGLQVDLRVVPPASYGAALVYFTGSRDHGIALRTLALKRGLKINEYGVFRGERPIAGRTEEQVYASLGLPWIAPELREASGEIEAAAAGRLPRLVQLRDIRGDLHAHTLATDGQDSLEAMAEAAAARGYEYLAITDHSRRLTVAHGLDEAALRRHMAAIDALNSRFKGFTLLKSVELDILEDGRLDLPDALLAELDLVVAAVHSKFDLPEARQTERIIRALDNPHVHILAHPSGRLLQQRPPYAVDLERILRAAKERGVAVEVNGQPPRMDLDDVHCRLAREMGVKLVISTDAHSTAQLDNMRFGVAQARRGWVEAKNVLNTHSLPTLRRLLRR